MARRLFDYINNQLNSYPLDRAFGSKKDGSWHFYSTSEIVDHAQRLAAGLLKLGIQKGDKISLVAYKNRPEWVIIDLASLYIGAVNVPLYPTISAGEYEYIMNDAGVKLCFVGDGDLWEKVTTAQKSVPSLKHIFTMDKSENRPFYEDIMEANKSDEVKSISDSIQSDDLATIIYTSGTTGNPKGVMLSHGNIIHAVDKTLKTFPLTRGGKVLSFLPYCHIFERACIYGYTDAGVSVYCTGTDNLGGDAGDLKSVQPDFFTTVPRLLEKVYEKIYNRGLELSGIKKKLFFWALSLTENYEHGNTYSGFDKIKRSFADKLIFSKWREALGGNIKGIVTGAAPCPPKIIRVFSTAGIPVLEGYGLTETSPTLAINTFDGNAKVGTVGPIIDGVKIRIEDPENNYKEGEGEILASGPNIMKGYYNKPDVSAKVFQEIAGEKWFKTGDIGQFVDGPNGRQYLQITDRKKELLKTSGGKYVAPAPIESKLKEDFLIEQVMVIGDKQKYVSALIVPAPEALKEWCKSKGIAYSNLENACSNEKVIALYEKCIAKINPLFSHVEQIKKIKLLPTSWDATKEDNSEPELTPTMKLKRRVIRTKFSAEIDDLYKNDK